MNLERGRDENGSYTVIDGDRFYDAHGGPPNDILHGKCWICGDHAQNGQEGYSSAPMVLPGFEKPVWVCGNCIIRAIGTLRQERIAEEAAVKERQDKLVPYFLFGEPRL